MISDLLKDADQLGVPDLPMLAHAAKRLTGFDADEQYNIAVEAWVYGMKSFDPAKAKWSTYFYNTVGLIGRREWFKKTYRESTGVKMLHGSDPEVEFIESLPARETEDAAQLAELRDAVRRLPPRTAAIVIARFGLDDKPPMTLDALASKVGVSRERIRQVLLEAMDELRGAIA